LIEIPFWWDGSDVSIASAIHLQRPDIVPFLPKIPAVALANESNSVI